MTYLLNVALLYFYFMLMLSIESVWKLTSLITDASVFQVDSSI